MGLLVDVDVVAALLTGDQVREGIQPARESRCETHRWADLAVA
jgi:hypothetical protein